MIPAKSERQSDEDNAYLKKKYAKMSKKDKQKEEDSSKKIGGAVGGLTGGSIVAAHMAGHMAGKGGSAKMRATKIIDW